MNCQLCQKILDAYPGDNLTPDLRLQLEMHLKECNECARIYRLQVLADRVINEEKKAESNPFLSTRVMAAIEKTEEKGRIVTPYPLHLLRTALMMVTLAAAIFLGVMVGNISRTVYRENTIPLELSLIDDAALETIDMFSVE